MELSKKVVFIYLTIICVRTEMNKWNNKLSGTNSEYIIFEKLLISIEL